MPVDFQDITDPPDPTPKKHFLITPGNSGGLMPISWPAGVTFQAAFVAAIPAAIRNRTNATSFMVNLVIDANEV